jgi:hypothetical protein
VCAKGILFVVCSEEAREFAERLIIMRKENEKSESVPPMKSFLAPLDRRGPPRAASIDCGAAAPETASDRIQSDFALCILFAQRIIYFAK